MHGRNFDIPNLYKNSLLKAATPTVSTKSKYAVPRTYTISKKSIMYSPLRNTPDRYSYVRKSVQSLTGKDVKDWSGFNVYATDPGAGSNIGIIPDTILDINLKTVA